MWRYFALGSALFAALTAILTKVGVSGVSSNVATAIRTTVVLFLAWGVVLATGEGGSLKTISRPAFAWLIASGFATGLSWLCYFRAMHDGPASQVAPIDKLSLPLTIVIAVLFLGEKWNWQTGVGLALLLSGTFLLTRPQPDSPEKATHAVNTISTESEAHSKNSP